MSLFAKKVEYPFKCEILKLKMYSNNLCFSVQINKALKKMSRNTHLSRDPYMTLSVRTTPSITVCRCNRGTLWHKHTLN